MAVSEDNCLTCSLAEWFKTKVGRLHPSGEGRCNWKFVPPVIPAAFYYVGVGDMHIAPRPSGGHIRRSKPYENCACYVKSEATK